MNRPNLRSPVAVVTTTSTQPAISFSFAAVIDFTVPVICVGDGSPFAVVTAAPHSFGGGAAAAVAVVHTSMSAQRMAQASHARAPDSILARTSSTIAA